MKAWLSLSSDSTLFFPNRQRERTIFLVCLFFLTFFLALYSFYPGLHADLFFIDDELSLSSVPKDGFTLKNLATIWSPVPRYVFVPLMDTTLMLDYSLARLLGLNPYFVMRVASIFYLSLASLLVFSFFLKRHQIPLLAALVALVFALHPSHVIPTIWIASRKDVLVTLFMLLTVFFHIRKKRVFSFASFLLAFFSKQSAYGLLIWIVAYDFFYATEKNRPKLSFIKELRYIVVHSSPFIFALLILLPYSMDLSELHPSPMIFLWDKTLVLIKFYMGKVLWPFPITQYYPRPAGFPFPSMLISWAFLFSIFLGSVVLFRKNRLSLFVVSNLFFAFAVIQPYVITVPQVLYLNNAYTYCLIAPVLLLVFDGLLKAHQKSLTRGILVGLGVLVLCLFSFYGRFLSREFADPIRAFERNAELYPREPFIQMRLGHAAYFAGEKDRALAAFETALRLRVKRDRRISIDAFKGMAAVCVEEKKVQCLKKLDALAAKNNKPFYCLELAARLGSLHLSGAVAMDACRKRYPHKMTRILGPLDPEGPGN